MSGMTYLATAVNPEEAIGGHNPYLFEFGGRTQMKVLVWAKNVRDGLEVAAKWLRENAPGAFADPEEGLDDEALTYTKSGWLLSWDWRVYDVDVDVPVSPKSFDRGPYV